MGAQAAGHAGMGLRLLFGLGFTAGWVIFLIAIWRAMRAFEGMADSLRALAARPPASRNGGSASE